MRTGSKQLLLIAGAILLTTVLYFAPKKPLKKTPEESMFQGFSFEEINKEAKGQL